MASVDWQFKAHGKTSFSAVLRHCDPKQRLVHEHDNPHIDKSLTRENVNYTSEDYEEVLEKYDRRISFLDETTNKNKRTDRVTLFGLEVPAPDGMTDEIARAFFQKAVDHMRDKFGEENFICAYAHFDEIHDYIDHGEMKVSRPHLHTYIVPEVSGQLNGRKFSSMANIRTLNAEMEDICVREFGCHFMSGADARTRTIKDLKRLTEEEYRRRELALSLVSMDAYQPAPFQKGKVIVKEEELRALKEELAIFQAEEGYMKSLTESLEDGQKKLAKRYEEINKTHALVKEESKESRERYKDAHEMMTKAKDIASGAEYETQTRLLMELERQVRETERKLEERKKEALSLRREILPMREELDDLKRYKEMEEYMKSHKDEKGRSYYDKFESSRDKKEKEEKKR